MTEFNDEDLTGSRFEHVSLAGARFRDVDLSGARFRLVDLSGVVIRGAALIDVDISGWVENLRVNGVDVVPLVEAELDRRYPDRAKMRPTDADGFREAWDILETAVAAGPSSGPDGWLPSCCTSRWRGSGRSSRRCGTWCSPPTPGCGGRSSATRRRGTRSTCLGRDAGHPGGATRPRGAAVAGGGARPAPDRMATVRQVLAGLTDERWPATTEPVPEPGLPGVAELPGPPVPAGRSSTRSGSTGSTPSGTSTCWSRDPPDRGECVS